MIDKYYSEPGSFTQKQINPVIARCKWLSPQLAVEAAKRAIMICGAFGYTKDSTAGDGDEGRDVRCGRSGSCANIMKIIISRDIFRQ